MLFLYRGISNDNKKVRGYITAESRIEALQKLRYEEGLNAIYYLQEKINHPVLNKAREDLEKSTESMREYFNKTIEKVEQRKEDSKKVKQQGNKISIFNNIRSKLENISGASKQVIKIDKEMYENLFTLFKEQKDQMGSGGNLGTQQFEIEQQEKPEILERVSKRQKKETTEVDWSLIENEENSNIKKNTKIKVKEEEIILFTKRLAMMLSSGLTLIKALRIIEGTVSKQLSLLIRGVIDDIQDGNSFSYAISKYPNQFDTTYIALVQIGETSGSFEKCLSDIVEYQEKRRAIQKKIKTATIYPAIMGVVLAIFVVVGSIYFIPMFENLFLDQGIELPGITQAVFKMADVAPYVIIFGVLLIIFIGFIRKRIKAVDRTIQEITSKLVLKIPIVKKLTVTSNMYTFSSTVALMLRNGLRINDILVLIMRVVKNVYIKSEINSMSYLITQGLTFSEAMEEQEHFDSLLSSIVLTGEESGTLESALSEIALYYNDELNNRISVVVEMFQPLTILIIAVVAIPIVLAVYLPILEISSGSFM